MKNNQFFNIYKDNCSGELKFITTVNVHYTEDIWKTITNKYLNIKEYAEMLCKNPYNAIYRVNLKDYIQESFPLVYEFIRTLLLHDNIVDINDWDVLIYLGTSGDYRKVNEQYDNEMKFLEYVNSEVAEMDKLRNITEDVLVLAGFEYLEDESNLGKEYQKANFGIDNYKVFRKWIDSKNSANVLKLDIDNGWNNRGTGWHLHIDNNVCDTIGSADIDTVWQFNTLMQVFNCKFKL